MKTPMATRALGVAAAALLLIPVGCRDGTGPDPGRYTLVIEAGTPQIGPVGKTLAEPLQVRVTVDGAPAPGVAIEWRVTAGTGATLTPSISRTDSSGIAEARLRLGSEPGVYRVEAAIQGASLAPARFEATAVYAPVLISVHPQSAAVGDTITLTGEHLGAAPAETRVLFDGIRGTIVSISETRIEVTVPHCVPTRQAQVTVALGPVMSEALPMNVAGADVAPIELDVGEVLEISEPDAMECIPLPGHQPGAAYLIIPQNAARVAGQGLPIQLVGVTEQTRPVATAEPAPGALAGPRLQRYASREVHAEWEAGLRVEERALPVTSALRPDMGPAIRAQETPSIGDRRSFNVYNREKKFSQITAAVKYISERAIVYQDVNAPPNGFTDQDFAHFTALFDDPIFPTVTGAFGEPSDVDGNGRIIILFTPVVNELTPRGAAGFVAGFFYGLDLTEGANSNRAEIFYSVVPDPGGRYGDPRSRDDILRTVPGVLAHELQHMVHFHERMMRRQAPRPEAVWLSEALAHMAEDLVADTLRARGDAAGQQAFQLSNYIRALRYLQGTTGVSVIDVEAPGSLEERGAQWLFLKYLAGHYGGAELLGALTRTTRTGIENVEAATGRTWDELFGAWTVALWADDAPELRHAQVDPRYTFTNIDLRAALGQFRGGFPLQPARYGFRDFQLAVTLPVASPLHVIVQADPFLPSPLHLSYARIAGAAFHEQDRPRFAIMRIE